MPGYRKSLYTPKINSEIRANLMSTLEEASDYDSPTTDWLKNHNMILSNFTNQKLARSLNELWEMGLVKKEKSKSGRMVYRLTSKLREDGYIEEE